jgi:hypothetical protein
MQKSVLAVLVLSSALVVGGAAQAAGVDDRLESGSIQAYDGGLGLLRVMGHDFVLSERARRQLEDYLALDPARRLENLTIRFEPRRRNGKLYIDSVVIPQDEA